MLKVKIVKFNETQPHKIKEILEQAGFKSETNQYGIRLIDKKYPNADDYADLKFRNLKEVVRVMKPYLMKINYRIVL